MSSSFQAGTAPPAYQEVFPTAPTELDVTRLPGPATENRTVTRIDIDRPAVRYIRSDSCCEHSCESSIRSCEEAEVNRQLYSGRPTSCCACIICIIPFLLIIGAVVYLCISFADENAKQQDDCYWNCSW